MSLASTLYVNSVTSEYIFVIVPSCIKKYKNLIL